MKECDVQWRISRGGWSAYMGLLFPQGSSPPLPTSEQVALEAVPSPQHLIGSPSPQSASHSHSDAALALIGCET